VTRILGSSWTHYIWEGIQVIGEHDATTAYSPTYAAASARLDYTYFREVMINSRQRSSSTAPWTTNYYISDPLSLRLTLDVSGNVVGRQGHLPFGEDFGETGTQEKHHFTTYGRDSATSTDYAVNRSYYAGTARFNSADPYQASDYLVDPQSWNRYAYVGNDPIHNVDPEGLFRRTGANRNDPDPCSPIGGSGPPDRSHPPTCSRGFAENTEGHFFSDTIPLLFFDNSRREGTAGWAEGFGFGNYVNTLIGFEVSDDVANWNLHQKAHAVTSGSVADDQGNVYKMKTYDKWFDPDNPQEGGFVKNPGDHWLYWVDAPGVPDSFWPEGTKPWNMTSTFDVTSWITSDKGGLPCTVTWHTRIVWKEGKITEWGGTTDNPPQ
jgi:RHS repeat-associated protein